LQSEPLREATLKRAVVENASSTPRLKQGAKKSPPRRTKAKRPDSHYSNVAKASQVKIEVSRNFIQLASPKAGKPREAGLHSALKVNEIHRAKGG